MLDYARQRVREAISTPSTAVLATSGLAGVQAGEFRCEAVDLELYLLVPRTSDHLFNLEHDPSVTLLAAGWEMKGKAQVISPESAHPELILLHDPDAKWCVLVKVDPCLLHFRRNKGWGSPETIELRAG